MTHKRALSRRIRTLRRALLMSWIPLLIPAFAPCAPAIDRIEVERLGVFPETTATPLPWVLRLVNRLHPLTREQVIRREILFREGAPLDSLQLAESERLLRERGIFESVRVSHLVDDTAHVARIRTQDLWTFGVILSYEKQAEVSSVTLGIRDTNLLGTGNRAYLSQVFSTDKNSVYASVDLPRLGTTRAGSSLLYADQSDGISRFAAFERAIETPFDRWGWGLRGYAKRGRQRFFTDGKETGASGSRRYDLGAHLGRYPDGAIQAGYGAGWVDRFVSPVGEPVSYVEGQPPPPAFTSRRHVGPIVFGGLMHRRFVRTRNLERYGTTEDVPLGWSIHLTAGPNLLWRTNRERAFAMRAGLAGAAVPIPRIGVAADLSGMLQLHSDRGPGERQLRALMTLGWQPNPRSLTFAQATLLTGAGRPATAVSYLGSGAGLRGFPARAFEVREFLLTTLEQRFWTGVEILWVGIGGNVFIDAGVPSQDGRLWGDRWRTGWGGGLLLGLRKSSQRPIRVEVAWRTDRRADPTFSVATTSLLRLIPRIALPPPVPDFPQAVF